MAQTKHQHPIGTAPVIPPVTDPKAWTAQDAAGQAIQAASLAQQYYRMTSDKVSEIQGDIDALALTVSSQGRKQNGVENDRASLRNTCMVWGGGSAIIAAIAVALVIGAAPNPRSLQIEKVQDQHFANQKALLESQKMLQAQLNNQAAIQAAQKEAIEQLQSNQNALHSQLNQPQPKPKSGGKKGG